MICEPYPYRPALEAFAPLAGRPFAHLFAGGREAGHSWGGAWDIILAAPVRTLEVIDGIVEIDGQPMAKVSDMPPFDCLKRMLADRALAGDAWRDLPDGIEDAPFLTGAAGYIAYEGARWLEPVLAGIPDPAASMPEMAVGFYDAVLMIHRTDDRAFVVARHDGAAATLRGLLSAAVPDQAEAGEAILARNDDRDRHVGAVAAIRDRILDGTVFQANMTRQLEAVWPERRWQELALPAYRRLSRVSSSPYGALLQAAEGCALSDSPEKFLEVRREGGALKVIAEPVKGTRPRHTDPQVDRAAAADLLGNEKDRAENIMIADLVRNDLSRVCRDHSIREEAVCELQSFANVHHLVSRISGLLEDGLGAVDALAASYPCGSITGAPKISAMQVIAEQEGQGRGVYCGAIGLFDDRGGAMVSVPIRTGVLQQDGADARLTYGAGGGITVLSDPQAEYQETADKARPFLRMAGQETAAP